MDDHRAGLGESPRPYDTAALRAIDGKLAAISPSVWRAGIGRDATFSLVQVIAVVVSTRARRRAALSDTNPPLGAERLPRLESNLRHEQRSNDCSGVVAGHRGLQGSREVAEMTGIAGACRLDKV